MKKLREPQRVPLIPADQRIGAATTRCGRAVPAPVWGAAR